MLKALLFIEILVMIGATIFHMTTTRVTHRVVGHLPAFVFGVLAALMFLSPQLLIAHIAVGLVPLLFGRTKLQVGMIMAIGMIAVPSLQSNLAIGSLPLFGWTIQSSIGVGALLALLVTPGKLARGPVWADSVLLIITAVLLVVDSRGTEWTNWLRQLTSYVFGYGIPVFVMTRCAKNAEERKILLTALAAAGIILSVIVLYEARGSWPLYAPLAHHFGFETNGLVVKWRGGLMRAYGPMSEATNMAMILVICFSAAFASRRAFVSNTHYIAIVALIAIGTLAPQSRGGLIGIAIAFVISSFYRRGMGSLGQMIAASTLVLGAYVAASAIGSIGGHLQQSLNDGSGTSTYRSDLLRRGLEEFWKSPVFGDSAAHVTAHMQDMVQGEGIIDFVNTYLYFALFAGGIGLVVFCLAFIMPMARLVVIRRHLPPLSAERDVAGFSLAVLGSAAVMLAFSSYAPRPAIFWLTASGLAMIMGIPRRAANRAKPGHARLSPSSDLQAA